MKKLILLPIVILIMSFGIITNVYAETCTPIYNIIPSTGYIKTYTGKNEDTLTISTNSLSLNNYEYYKIPYMLVNNYIEDYNSKTIDLHLTCSNPQWTNHTGSQTITYADGSTATISGTEWDTYCQRYNLYDNNNNNATIFGFSYNTTNDINLRLTTLTNNNQNISGAYTYIDKNTNSFVILKHTDTITGLRFYFSSGNFNKVSYTYGISRPLIYGCNSDTQQIINNQNQNTTTISNNITNLNDNILNSNINSQTSTDVGNISSNNINSSSKNVILDFMLLPITFIQNLLNSFDNTCATLCIGNCSSGHDNDWRFVFPCIDLQSILGSTVYNVIDVLMTFGMVFAFARSVVGFLKKALLLESDVSSEVRIF